MDKECYQKPEMIRFSTWINAVRGDYCLGGHCVGADVTEPCNPTDEGNPDSCTNNDPF